MKKRLNKSEINKNRKNFTIIAGIVIIIVLLVALYLAFIAPTVQFGAKIESPKIPKEQVKDLKDALSGDVYAVMCGDSKGPVSDVNGRSYNRNELEELKRALAAAGVDPCSK